MRESEPEVGWRVGCWWVSSRTGVTGLFTTSVFPGDPWALPAPQQRLQACRQLLELLPGAYLDADTYEYLRWVGHGVAAAQAPLSGLPAAAGRAVPPALSRQPAAGGPAARGRAVLRCRGALNAELGWPWETG
jgi:hypothetical protein